MTGRVYNASDFPAPEPKAKRNSKSKAKSKSENDGSRRDEGEGLNIAGKIADLCTFAPILEFVDFEEAGTDSEGRPLWLRPGDSAHEYSAKELSDGYSLHVFTDAAEPLQINTTYTRADLLATLHYDSDLSALCADVIRAARSTEDHPLDYHPALAELPDELFEAVRKACGPTVLREEAEGSGEAEGEDKRLLQFQWFRDMAYEVDNAPPRQWLIQNIFPHGDYGVLSAEPKAQKTWGANDLAVSVASGTPWLGYKPVEVTGPVMMFVGEGGRSNTVRRIRALAVAKKVDADGLPIIVCARAPYLTVRQHLEEMEAKIAEVKPVLVIIDPLYLAARGANLADLYAMGEVLGNAQAVCQRHNASLLLVHHFNRNQAASGAARNSGAGPQEWARVLMSATVASRKAGELPGETVVITKIEIQGGEVPDQTLRVIRRIWADDPDDLSSPMHVVTLASEEDESEEVDTGQGKVTLPPAAVKIVEALAEAAEPIANDEIVDKIANRHGHGLKRETVSRQLNSLQDRGFVDHEEHKIGHREGKRWFLSDSGRKWQKARSEPVTTCDQSDSEVDLLSEISSSGQNRRSEPVTAVTVTCDDTSERGTCDRVTAALYKAVTPVTPSQQDQKTSHIAPAVSDPNGPRCPRCERGFDVAVPMIDSPFCAGCWTTDDASDASPRIPEQTPNPDESVGTWRRSGDPVEPVKPRRRDPRRFA